MSRERDAVRRERGAMSYENSPALQCWEPVEQTGASPGRDERRAGFLSG